MPSLRAIRSPFDATRDLRPPGSRLSSWSLVVIPSGGGGRLARLHFFGHERVRPPRRDRGILRASLLARRPPVVDRAPRRLGHVPLRLRAQGRSITPRAVARALCTGGGGSVRP